MRAESRHRLEAAAAGVADLTPDDGFGQRADAFFAGLHPRTCREIELALAIVDHPLSGAVWGRRMSRLAHMTPAERARRISAMMDSRVSRVRAIASAVRSAAAALVWSDPEVSATVAPSLGNSDG